MTESDLKVYLESMDLTDQQANELLAMFENAMGSPALPSQGNSVAAWEFLEAQAQTWEEKAKWRAKIVSFNLDHAYEPVDN